MKPQDLARQYLPQFKIMQLATSENDVPWLCTVHFYTDDNLNFYWVSRTDRKHSKQIEKNPYASVTVVVHENTPEEDYVISVTASGKAEMLLETPPKLREVYAKKLNKPPHMLPASDDPSNMNEFYCLQTATLTLFDTKNFPQKPRQEVRI